MTGRDRISLLVDPHEHASEGSRLALAALLDSIGLELRDRGEADLAWYAWGRADGLRRASRSRRVRPSVVN